MKVVLIVLLLLASVLPTATAQTLPTVGKVAPNFTLTDTDGKKRSLVELTKEKRPVALFFFCGCTWCADVAREWAQLQRSNALPDEVLTVIVYQGSSAELKSLAVSCGLDLKKTVLLADRTYSVTTKIYHADPCPRIVLVSVDAKNHAIVRYINNNKDDQPRKAPASLIVAKANEVLRVLKENRLPERKP